jgi:hypothetical protein
VTAEALRAPSAGSLIPGQWVRLVPVSAYADAALAELRYRLGLRPEMVAPGVDGAPAGSSRFGEAAVIVDAATGAMLGVIGNEEIGDYPGVAALVIYVDEARTRAGYAMEAWWRYVERIFQLGAVKVQMEVMAFNTPVHRIMRRIGARPEAVLREHFFIAGKHWDGTLYGFDRPTWEAVDRKYRAVVERPTALGRAPRSTGLTNSPSPKEDPTVKVDYLVFADAAITADGKQYLHGAGWESLFATGFPVFHRHMSVALRLRVAPAPAAKRLAIDLVDPQGDSLLSAPMYVDLPAVPGPAEQLLCLVFDLDSIHFAAPGAYAVLASVDGVELHRAGLNLIQSP